MEIKIKRVYESPDEKDGFRILIDRLWPRGLSKDKVKTNLWLKEVSPSDKLRKWFSHDVKKWTEFKKKYEQELKDKDNLIRQIKTLGKEHKKIVLLFSAKDELHNNAVVLMDYLKK